MKGWALLGVALVACGLGDSGSPWALEKDAVVNAEVPQGCISAALDTTLEPTALFPRHLGDRWAYSKNNENVFRTVTSVVALPGAETAYVVGTDLGTPQRFFASDEGVNQLVGEDAQLWLAGPVQQGTTWNYRFGPLECEARYERGLTCDLGEQRFSCVEVRRDCASREAHERLGDMSESRRTVYCDAVGVFHESIVRRATGESLSDEQHTQVSKKQLVHYEVRGAPELPSSLDCSSILLLPSDITSLCGGRWTRGEITEPGRCGMGFYREDGAELLLSFATEPLPPDIDFQGEAGRFYYNAMTNNAVCEGALPRLRPLLESLLR